MHDADKHDLIVHNAIEYKIWRARHLKPTRAAPDRRALLRNKQQIIDTL